MPEIVLEARVGREQGTRVARRLRRQGWIPGTIYGRGTDPISVAVGARELRNALSSEAGTNALLSVQAGGESFLTLARELQRHPVKGTLTHVDFVIVRRDEVISAEVPINLVGEPVELHHRDGIVEQLLFTLPVRALPGAIPNSVELDISTLSVGGAMHVGELVLPDGVSADIDPEATIVVGQPPRVEAAPVVEAEEAVAVAPEAGTQAESGTAVASSNDEG